jgi:Pyruvate/2-oxoacid:ferredoxin oxidoreductase delta subunit
LLGSGKFKPNGTAVEGVCVTGEASRQLVLVVGREQSRWQAGMAQYLQVPANVKSVICAVNCPEPEVTIVFRGLAGYLSRLNCQGCFANIVTSKLPQLTVLATVKLIE